MRTRGTDSCVRSKNHGSNEEPSTHQHISIPISPTVTLTLPHERYMLRLISPGHQSSVSCRALAPSYIFQVHKALEVTNSPVCHRQQSPGVQTASQPARETGSNSQSDLMDICSHIIERSVFLECSGSCRLMLKAGNPCHCRACSLP